MYKILVFFNFVRMKTKMSRLFISICKNHGLIEGRLIVELYKQFVAINVSYLNYNIITNTSPCNEDPFTPHFYRVKLGFTGVYIIFLFLL